MKKTFIFLALILSLTLVYAAPPPTCANLVTDYYKANISFYEGYQTDARYFDLRYCDADYENGTFEMFATLTNGSIVVLKNLTVADQNYSDAFANMGFTQSYNFTSVYDGANVTIQRVNSSCNNFSNTYGPFVVYNESGIQRNYSLQVSTGGTINATGVGEIQVMKQAAYVNRNDSAFTADIQIPIDAGYNSSTLTVINGANGSSITHNVSGNTVNFSAAVPSDGAVYYNVSYNVSAINVTGLGNTCTYDTAENLSGNCTAIMNITNLLPVKLNDITFKIDDGSMFQFDVGMTDISVYFNLVSGDGIGSYYTETYTLGSSSLNATDYYYSYPSCFEGLIGTFGDLSDNEDYSAGTFSFSNASASNTTFSTELSNSSSRSLENGPDGYTISSVSTTRDVGASSSYQFIVRYDFTTGYAAATGGGGGATSEPKLVFVEQSVSPFESSCGVDVDGDGDRCDLNEDWISCPTDCNTPTLNQLFCTTGPDCLWGQAWFLKVLFAVLLLTSIYLVRLESTAKKRRRVA